MIRNLLVWTAGCLLTAFAVSSCESDGVDYGPISAALEIVVEDVTPSSAKIKLATEQENVASYLIVKPTPISEFEYAAHDAIDRMAFVEEHGQKAEAPYAEMLSGLMPKVEYFFAVVGFDASGQRVTAPTFARFKTAYASSLVEARFDEQPDGKFAFSGKITPNAYTVSYRYIFDSAHNDATEEEMKALLEAGGAGVETGTGVKTVEVVESQKVSMTLAVLSYDDAGRPGELTTTFVSTEDMVSVMVDGKETQLVRPTEGVDIFEGKAAVPAKGEFTIEINKVAYGFAPYSGNGGVGKVENMMSAMPYYTASEIGGAHAYDVKKAVGRMAEGGTKFWTNLSGSAQLFVRVDLTYADGTPRYYFELVEADDPNLVLEQNFDLFVWGGDYLLGASGSGTSPAAADTSAAALDGTEEGTKGTASYTGVAPDDWSTPGAVDESGNCIASAAYLRNRDVAGWEIAHVAEQAGMIRMNKSSSKHQYSGWVMTPQLPLSGATDITVEFDMCRFGNNADNIYVTIVGDGAYTAATVNPNGGAAQQVAASGQDFVITEGLCAGQDNKVVNKPWTHVKLSVAGATGQTRIKIDASRGSNSTKNRMLLDNIKITK